MATVRELMVFRVRLLLDVASLIDHNIWVVGRGELNDPVGVSFDTPPLPGIFVVASFFFAFKAKVGVAGADEDGSEEFIVFYLIVATAPDEWPNGSSCTNSRCLYRRCHCQG